MFIKQKDHLYSSLFTALPWYSVEEHESDSVRAVYHFGSFLELADKTNF